MATTTRVAADVISIAFPQRYETEQFYSKLSKTYKKNVRKGCLDRPLSGLLLDDCKLKSSDIVDFWGFVRPTWYQPK